MTKLPDELIQRMAATMAEQIERPVLQFGKPMGPKGPAGAVAKDSGWCVYYGQVKADDLPCWVVAHVSGRAVFKSPFMLVAFQLLVAIAINCPALVAPTKEHLEKIQALIEMVSQGMETFTDMTEAMIGLYNGDVDIPLLIDKKSVLS